MSQQDSDGFLRVLHAAGGAAEAHDDNHEHAIKEALDGAVRDGVPLLLPGLTSSWPALRLWEEPEGMAARAADLSATVQVGGTTTRSWLACARLCAWQGSIRGV